MKIIVRGQKIKIPSELKSYVIEKVKKYEPLVQEPAKCEVVFEDENGLKGGIDKVVKITLSLPGLKNPIFICERSSDFMGSVDLAQERLEHQILKYKEQVKIGSRFPNKYWLEKELNTEEE
ncbi:MAG: ribosome-associated translation inhibitor RaiA [Patescibacteria group bacterium]|jgi:ribosomal subunit interface protein